MIKSDKKLIVVCGPTASGKTSRGVKIAAAFDGEIISADSRQVYRGMDIGTGKDLSEYTVDGKTIPFHCIDIADPDENFTLYHYIDHCHDAMKKIFSRTKTPIIVGGTGLYIEAILKKYRIPAVPEYPDLRDSLKQNETAELIHKLKTLDREIYEQTDLSSKNRIIRSIEIALYKQNKPLFYAGENPPESNPVVLAVYHQKNKLKSMISRRLRDRIEQGMIAEVETLIKNKVSPERMISFGMEYKFITLYLLKKISLDEALTLLETGIHRLAKRQMTWFRGMEKRGIKIHWITGNLEDEAMEILKSVR